MWQSASYNLQTRIIYAVHWFLQTNSLDGPSITIKEMKKAYSQFLSKDLPADPLM
jgi:hypothetical protein